MNLWAFIRVLSLFQLLGLGIYEKVPLGRTTEPIGEMEAGIEPLWGIGSGHLASQHVTEFIVKSPGIFGRVKVLMSLPPVSPTSGKAVKNLAGVSFPTKNGLAPFILKGLPRIILLRNACLSEIFLSQNIYGQLGPVFRGLNVVLVKYHRAIGIADF